MTLSALVLLGLLHGQSESVETVQVRVKQRLLESVADSGLPGMTAAFVLADGRTGSIAIGKSNLEKGTAMKPTDRILSGSTGKTFFAALAMLMVAEKQLDLEAHVSQYLGKEPWYSRIPNHETITIRQLLNHTSGIPEHVELKATVDTLLANSDKNWKPRQIVEFLFDRKPLFEAGKGWSYADANYILLGVALEKILGKSAYGEIERRFLKPFKLTSTSPSVSRSLQGLVQGYSMDNSPFGPKGPVLKDGKLSFNPSFEWAGGGFISNSADLARWAWLLWGGKVVPSAQLEAMKEGVKAKTGPNDLYGLATMIEPTSVGSSFGHEGWYPGYLTQTMYLPDHKIAVAVQFNTDDFKLLKHRTRWFCDLVARAVLNLPEK